LKQGEGVEVSPSKDAEGFGIEPKILNKVRGNHGIGNAEKHREDIKGREDEED
jgi:hypothetical protein